MTRVRRHTKKLGQFLATAICGNDILSSTLYVSGISILFAGFDAPIVLLAVAGVLFFYRAVYREVVEALPVNGGTYNVLLNATSKSMAAVGGVMTILSLIATAVLSAKTAVAYLFTLAERIFTLSAQTLNPWVIPGACAILVFFALLVLLGMKDSARVAAAIFVFHLGTLGAFILLGALFILTFGPSIGAANAIATRDIIAQHGGILKTLFLAFSVSLLGISGFQSSTAYVEEEEHGVFAKTLRNMTLGVAIFNPLIAAVILRLMPIADVAAAKDFLLAEIAGRIGGTSFLAWIALDAFFVLCGAVLASFIGARALMKRMSQDGCLPSSVRPIAVFLLLCIGLLLITGGDLLSLAGVYTISFLGVMSLFAVGILIMRRTRPELQRPYRAPFPFILFALGATLIGLAGTIAVAPQNAGYFLTYFLPAMAVVLSVLYQKDLFETLAKMTSFLSPVRRYFERKRDEAASGRITVFIHHISRLSPILEYVKKNETVVNVTLVHCRHHHPRFVARVERALESLQEAGFFREFHFTVEYLNEPFGPKLLDAYAKRKRIPKSRIFMGSIHHSHDFTYEDLGSVRIIF